MDEMRAFRWTAQVIDELPDLEPDDIRAAVAYARCRVDHPVVAGRQQIEIAFCDRHGRVFP